MTTTNISGITQALVEDIPSILHKQRKYFDEGNTLSVDFRINQLKKLREVIVKHEEDIKLALYKDLRKSATEAYVTEIGIVLMEIEDTLRNLRTWAKPTRMPTTLFHKLASSYVYHDPLGTVLIISPWNYPFQLLIAPLIGAISGGNTMILKPSELSPNTSELVNKIISENFAPEYIKVILGGIAESKALLEEKFDHIFFTGGTEIGRQVYMAAAKHLTPVVLELGGKSPCIVDKDIHLEHTSRRILWGKYTNAGQTCVAPDYLFVHKSVKPKLIEMFKKHLKEMYGDDVQKSPDYGRIISLRHFDRIVALMQDGNIIHGGKLDKNDLYIEPTFIENVNRDMRVMQEEIFGPVLPIMEYENLDDVVKYINAGSKPLALYVYSSNTSVQDEIMQKCSFGGGCINESVMHVGQLRLPFGGVGDSGIGAYHGKTSFDVFTHKKSILKKSTLSDLPIKYPPYKNNLPILKKLMAWLG
jgi:aldehyde dehydrogenase (NAD+)